MQVCSMSLDLEAARYSHIGPRTSLQRFKNKRASMFWIRLSPLMLMALQVIPKRGSPPYMLWTACPPIQKRDWSRSQGNQDHLCSILYLPSAVFFSPKFMAVGLEWCVLKHSNSRILVLAGVVKPSGEILCVSFSSPFYLHMDTEILGMSRFQTE